MLKSISALSALTGVSRRTIKHRIEPLKPRIDGRAHLYETRSALPLIFGTAAGRKLDLTHERAALAREKRLATEMRRRELASRLMPRSLVVELHSCLAVTARGRFSEVPVALRRRFPTMPRVADEVEQLIDEALADLGSDSIPPRLHRH